MKIAFISPETSPVPPIRGGAVQAKIFELITRLSKSTEIYCFSIFDSSLPRFEKKENINFYRFKPGIMSKILTFTYKLPFKNSGSFLYWFTYSCWCAWKIKKINIDIINIYNRIQFIPILKFLNPGSKIILHIRQVSALNCKRLWNNKVISNNTFDNPSGKVVDAWTTISKSAIIFSISFLQPVKIIF